MSLSALPVIVSVLSSVYAPFHSMYKEATSYDSHYGWGRSDYDEEYDSFDKWDSEYRRRRRGPGKRPRVRRLNQHRTYS